LFAELFPHLHDCLFRLLSPFRSSPVHVNLTLCAQQRTSTATPSTSPLPPGRRPTPPSPRIGP
jgi:hypothetical protein